LFGVDTGNKAAKAVAAGVNDARLAAEQRAKLAGKEFEPNENWRIGQPWSTRRVEKFSEAEFVKDWRELVDSGAVKLIDKEAGPGRFYATAARTDDILKKAYADIKYEGGTAPPFSKDIRTFEFQPGKPGADAWLRMQAKYGAGNEIMQVITQHMSQMAKEIASLETLGPNPQGAFEAALRLAKEKNPTEALATGLRWFDSDLVARNTFNEVSGKGTQVGNELWARRMSATRQLLGAAALRNLPVNIVPSDMAATFIAAHHDGISFGDIMRHTFDGSTTRQEAAHLEIAAHSYKDFVQNNVRRYEDEINYSGIARLIPDRVIRATGANWWTENLRLGTQMGYFHKLAQVADTPWQRLDPHIRDNFLAQYGINEAEWNKIRAIAPDVSANGAAYVNLPELTRTDRELSERLQRAVQERSSYMAHQPDARTRAIARGGAAPGTFAGEAQLGFAQYKQFALERMSTHLMRILYEGTPGQRIARGIAFTLLSTAAGAVAMQAAAVLAGKNPLDMYQPSFWMHAFAKGGVGGVYGDLLSEAFTGNAGAIGGAAGGTVGGLLGDIGKAVAAPARHALFDAQGRRATANTAEDMIAAGKRWTPNTWYTKLAVDRFLWDTLQSLVDPNYRQSFRRENQKATRRGGTGYWFAPGAGVPQ
jgi:hypothetical protein